MVPHILIVDDEEDLVELLEYHLQKEGYQTTGFLNTHNLEQFIYEEKIDLIIMDRNLPNIEGSIFIENLREKTDIKIPVFFVSAKIKDKEIEEGFERGADDYITKPFNIKELLLRIKALLRRTGKLYEDNDTIRFRDIILIPKIRSLKINNENVNLTKLEYKLLNTLIKNNDVVLSREYLLENVWNTTNINQEKTVNVAINRLKDKIDPTKKKNYIKSVRGLGYILNK